MSWRAALSLPVNVCRCVLCGSGVVGGWGEPGWGSGVGGGHLPYGCSILRFDSIRHSNSL